MTLATWIRLILGIILGVFIGIVVGFTVCGDEHRLHDRRTGATGTNAVTNEELGFLLSHQQWLTNPDLKLAVADFTLENRAIARAKRLQYDYANGTRTGALTTKEQQLATEEFYLSYSSPASEISGIFAGASMALAVFGVIFVAPFIIRWLWYFILARVRETSNAVRGQP